MHATCTGTKTPIRALVARSRPSIVCPFNACHARAIHARVRTALKKSTETKTSSLRAATGQYSPAQVGRLLVASPGETHVHARVHAHRGNTDTAHRTQLDALTSVGIYRMFNA